MPTLTDLQNAVTSLLDLPGIPATLQLNSTTRERAFEAYVLSLLVRAVRQAGGSAIMHGRNTGPNPAVVVFRGGPGMLGSDAQDYAYALCGLGNKSFEIHADVKYEGSSGAVHEIDVSLYDHSAADRVRLTPTSFAKTNKLHGAVECKFYDSSLGVVLGRTFVGLVDDCGTLRMRAFATNGHSVGLARYFTPQKRPQRYFGLSPLQPAIESSFVSVAEQILRQWAGVT